MNRPRTTHHRRRLLRLARLACRLAVLVATVHLGHGVAGTIVTASVCAAAAIVAGVTWWARVVEPRLFGDARPPATTVQRVVPRPAPAGDERHLAFARALAYVADRYLADCEDQAGKGRP